MTTTPARQCGSCTMCCKVLGIRELAKPVGAWCPHCAPGRGCKIYESRPSECRTFSCGWLSDPACPEDWRPDRSKLVFCPDSESRNVVVRIDAGSPDAWRREPYHSWLRNKAAQGLSAGTLVIVSVNNNATLILPEGEQFIGLLNAGDQIEAHRRTGPNGAMLEVKVIRHAPAPQTDGDTPAEAGPETHS